MLDASTGATRLQWQPGDAAITSSPLARVVFADAADPWACPLSWLDGDFRAESWLLGDAPTTGEAHGWHYRRQGPLAFATLHIDDGEPADDPGAVQRSALTAYQQLFRLQQVLGLEHPQRIWHWLSAVTSGTGDDQRYQRFCRGRADALDSCDHSMISLPPATLVSSCQRGLRMHVLLGDTPVTPIENPRQVSAYHYPRDYGVRPPAFARAGIVRMAGTRYLLISGTASIVGHETRHPGDVTAQALEALTNIDAVVDTALANTGDSRESRRLECIKAYVRDPAHAPTIVALLRERLPGVPLAVLHATLCRDDLLVEFEAQMPLG